MSAPSVLFPSVRLCAGRFAPWWARQGVRLSNYRLKLQALQQEVVQGRGTLAARSRGLITTSTVYNSQRRYLSSPDKHSKPVNLAPSAADSQNEKKPPQKLDLMVLFRKYGRTAVAVYVPLYVG